MFFTNNQESPPKEHYKYDQISYHCLKKICPDIPYFKNENFKICLNFKMKMKEVDKKSATHNKRKSGQLL
jgi:hypothetical protein